MTWANTKTRGTGRLRFAVVFEGWPEIWVSDPSITLTDATNGARGRAVRNGLSVDGLGFSERALPTEGRFQASGMRFKFHSTDQRDYATKSFARVGNVVDTLADSLTSSSSSISTMSGVSLTNGAYYHIGTETIKAGASGAITRGHWDTEPQAFALAIGTDETLNHDIFDNPPTLDGRRATLYVWGQLDDVTQYDPTGTYGAFNVDGVYIACGYPIWRGVVNRPPMLDRDCVTWVVSCDHIYSLMKQSLAARETVIRPILIAHSAGSPLYLRIGCVNHSGTPSESATHYFAGVSLSFSELCKTLNDGILADAVAELTSPGINQVSLYFDSATRQFRLDLNIGASAPMAVSVKIWSPIVGFILGSNFLGGYGWFDYTNKPVSTWNPIIPSVCFKANAGYHVYAEREVSAQVEIGRHTAANIDADGIQAWMSSAAPVEDLAFDPFSTAGLTVNVDYLPTNRIYIDKDWSLYGADTIAVDRSTVVYVQGAMDVDTNGWTIVPVTGSGTLTFGPNTIYYIDIDPYRSSGGPIGYLTDKTAIRVFTAGTSGIDAMSFLEELISRGPNYCNDGSHPFIRDVDVDTTEGISGNVSEQVALRDFNIVKSVSIEEVLSEELKLAAHMWFTTSTGKLGFRPIPLFTQNTATTRSIGTSDILTPEGGQGEWPGYEIQSQGIVGVVNIKSGYDPAEDTYKGQEFNIVDKSIIGTHKKRGLSEITIAPKSNPSSAGTQSRQVTLDVATASVIAANMISVFGREYATIRVQVPFTKFDYLIGDIVKLTCPQIPTTTGSRGVSNRRSCVIGRKWNLDAKRAEAGELELLVLLSEPSGYAPAGVITSRTNTSGTTWNLTLSSTNTINVLLSPARDGKVCETFVAGDYIRIVERDESSPTVVTGTVTSVTSISDRVTVDLDGAWTPGSSNWKLEYQDNPAGSTGTDSQELYAYVADFDQKLGTGSVARRFQ